jgi:hypothetical protein
MFWSFATAIVVLWLAIPISAQAQLAPRTAPSQTATPPEPASKKPPPRVGTEAKPTGPAEIGPCQIGVIPIAGNLFVIERKAPLNNTYARAAADGWGLDDLVVSRVRAAAPRTEVRRIAFSRDTLARARKPVPFFGDRDSNLKDFARQVAAGANCDRLVMVHRFGTGSVFGIGIINFVNLIENRTYLYAIMYVRIYDGRTFELIKEGPALIDDGSFLSRVSSYPIGGPFQVLDERSFPASRAEAVGDPVLREGVRALLTASLDKTLPAMLRQSAKETPH